MSKSIIFLFQLLNVKINKENIEEKFSRANTVREAGERKEVIWEESCFFKYYSENNILEKFNWKQYSWKCFTTIFSDFERGGVCGVLLQSAGAARAWHFVRGVHQGDPWQDVSQRPPSLPSKRAEGRGRHGRGVQGDHQVRSVSAPTWHLSYLPSLTSSQFLIDRNFEPSEDKSCFSSEGFMHFLTFSDMQVR